MKLCFCLKAGRARVKFRGCKHRQSHGRWKKKRNLISLLPSLAIMQIIWSFFLKIKKATWPKYVSRWSCFWGQIQKRLWTFCTCGRKKRERKKKNKFLELLRWKSFLFRRISRSNCADCCRLLRQEERNPKAAPSFFCFLARISTFFSQSGPWMGLPDLSKKRTALISKKSDIRDLRWES